MTNTVSNIAPGNRLLSADEIEAVSGGDAVNTFLNVVNYAGQRTCIDKTYVLGTYGRIDVPCPSQP